MPSISECLVPYLLSNLDLVTESLTLMAGNDSSPAAANWYSRSTPVVVSSVTPLTDSFGHVSICSAAHQYSSRVSPFTRTPAHPSAPRAFRGGRRRRPLRHGP